MLSYFDFHIEIILIILLTLAFPCMLGVLFAALYQKSVRYKPLWLTLWSLPLVAAAVQCIVNAPVVIILNDVPLFVPLYLSFGMAGRTFKMKSAKHWLAIVGLVLGTVLFSVLDYDLILFFLPVMNGVVLAYYFRIAKNKPLKILWFVLWGMLFSTILFRHVLFDFFNFSYEYLLEVGGPFLLFSLLVYFLKLGKKFCLIFCPIFMVVSSVAYMVEDGWLGSYATPFGSIVDSKLPSEMLEKNRGLDYELVIESSDAWRRDASKMVVQKRDDSTFVCRMSAPCGFGANAKDSCHWKLMDSASVKQLPSLIQSVNDYQQEEIDYVILDGGIFEVTYYDFQKGTRRYLEIGNAGFDVPNARALVLKSMYWLLPQDTSAAYRAEVEKCFENADGNAAAEGASETDLL